METGAVDTLWSFEESFDRVLGTKQAKLAWQKHRIGVE